MGEVIPFPTHRVKADPVLTKAQLGKAIGRSKRWIEQMQRDEGLPFYYGPDGRCRYRLREVREWDENRKKEAV